MSERPKRHFVATAYVCPAPTVSTSTLTQVSGANVTPRATSPATTSGLNGRLALGISALPGLVPNTVWYHSIGQGRRTYEYLIGWPYRSRYGSTATESFACHVLTLPGSSAGRRPPPRDTAREKTGG